ncbi:hypothetical protein ED312_08335 [Sinomicrobium pectinilyticum]|uniref:Uncharacterized protein n=1 Tax=Sinomicrobium pectinilyticum TaxID=1084421 RepID=A0A3N0EL02_SINP1|nr:hypothetical protein ED312_08335 [Sinomicrobium pectinilyticum]
MDARMSFVMWRKWDGVVLGLQQKRISPGNPLKSPDRTIFEPFLQVLKKLIKSDVISFGYVFK